MTDVGATRLIVTPAGPLRGVVSLPGDKSLAHRAALFAAVVDGESIIGNYPRSGVTAAMLNALSNLGVVWNLEGDQLRVEGTGFVAFSPPSGSIDCGNSATTLRLLAGALAATDTPAVVDGSSGLRRRPMRRIVMPLQMMGVDIQSTDGCAPLRISASPRPLKPITYTLPVASAQVKSCLLFAGLAASGSTYLIEPGPSRDHTERMLRGMGVSVISQQVRENGVNRYVTQLDPPHPLRLPAASYTLPGDISSAAFLIVAALVTPDSHVEIRNVGLNPTRTGLLDCLSQMGGDIQVTVRGEPHGEPVGELLVRHSALKGVHVSGELVVRMIDEFPAFAVAAAYACGETLVSGAGELRHKESDRITALCGQLHSLGVNVSEKDDGFVISGRGEIDGGSVISHGDHRLAMALAVAGLGAKKPVRVSGAEIIAESFPEFSTILESLGAKVRQEPVR